MRYGDAVSTLDRFTPKPSSKLALQLRFCVAAAMAALATIGFAQNASPLYGAEGVSPMAVRQGTLGSCYFHASIAAIAKADPAAIRKAMSGDPRNGYRVHFTGGPDELVYQEDVNFGRTRGYDKSEGEWVTVLMRAYAQRALRENMVLAIQKSTVIPVFAKPLALSALDQPGPLLVAYDRAIRSAVGEDGQLDQARFRAELPHDLSILGVTPIEAEALGGLLDEATFYDALQTAVKENGEVFGAYRTLSTGGIPAKVLRAFLGAAQASLIPASTLEAQLVRTHAGGTAMVARSKTTPPAALLQGGQPPDWFVPGHAYTVLDYDAAIRVLTLRNPWGAHPGPNGVFKLPLSTFVQAFSSYSYSLSSAR